MKFLWNAFNRWLVLFIAVLELQAVATDSPWSRVVMIGASASAGFVLTEPFGGMETAKCKLSHYLDAAITTPHTPVKNLGTALMFMNPDAFGPMQIQSVTNSKPTLVIGVDFLFWFCYGDGATDAERAQRFEQGLKLLEQIPCPLVVGDVPDASAATNTGIISIDQVPSEAARRAANQRLKTWAKAHTQVTVVPLAEFMRATMADAAIKVHNGTLPVGQTRALLQADQLHPNSRGAAVLSLGILDALVQTQKKFSASQVNWNAEEVLKAGRQKAARL